MKKIIATLAFMCVVAANCFAPELKTGISWLNDYAKCFPDTIPPRDRTRIRTSPVFSRPIEDDVYDRFATLDDDSDIIDTVLEWALATYYSPAVLTIRPKEADAILPANNPKLADQKLGAAVFQEIQVLRFLGDTAAVNRHEAVLQFITGRGNATRAEIEKFYRDNIAKLVTQIVDEQFTRLKNEGEIVPSARALTRIKDSITSFMLAPNSSTYANLLDTHRLGDVDGTALVLSYSTRQINPSIADALADRKVLTGGG